MDAPNTDLPVEPVRPIEAKHDLPSRDSVETSNFTSPSAVRDKVSTFAREAVVDLQKVLSPDSQEVLHEEPWIKGAVQLRPSSDHPDETRDIGWHKPVAEIPNPLIGGLSNSKLWSLIQRFNKDVFDVKAVPLENTRGLDLNDAWSEDHASDKLALNMQRLYLTVFLSIATFSEHVSRLRSWDEPRRTTTFCFVGIALCMKTIYLRLLLRPLDMWLIITQVYSIGWYYSMLMPLMLGITISVVASPTVRIALFPATARPTTQKNSTGSAPYNRNSNENSPEQDDQAVEKEAQSFVYKLRDVVLGAIEVYRKNESHEDRIKEKVPKPIRNVASAFKAEASNDGNADDEDDDSPDTKEEIVLSKFNPENLNPIITATPHAVGELVDNWERFANTMAPVAPFSRFSYLRIVAFLLPIFVASIFLDINMIFHAITFTVGFAFFADPVITPLHRWLNKNYPQWLELLEPKNNILRGVPTNAQLTLTLLRIGEAYHTPLPPVPSSTAKREILDHRKSSSNTAEVQEPHFKVEVSASEEANTKQKPATQHKHIAKLFRLLKKGSEVVVDSKLVLDKARATAGSETAKGHLGVLPNQKSLIYAGPEQYKARYDGKKGWIHITNTQLEASVWFSIQTSTGDSQDTERLFDIAIEDIRQIKRAAAFVNKGAEKVAGWSGDKDLLGSLEVDDKSGKTWRITAIPERDELFNRLVAIGGQRWESQ